MDADPICVREAATANAVRLILSLIEAFDADRIASLTFDGPTAVVQLDDGRPLPPVFVEMPAGTDQVAVANILLLAAAKFEGAIH